MPNATFAFAGYAKVSGLAGTTNFFTSLHIPAPAVMAPVIGYLEFLGGIAILLGLFTRIAGVLLACDMVGAILLSRGPATLAKGFDFAQMRTESLLLLGALALAAGGAGAVALDAVLFKGEVQGRKAPA